MPGSLAHTIVGSAGSENETGFEVAASARG